MNPQVFREYDIRGMVEDGFRRSISSSTWAAPTRRCCISAGKRTITLGRDCRLSSRRAARSADRGSAPGGINVVDIGVVPTPLLYFSVLHWKMDGGAMITGSHNAAEYNGFKLGVGPTTIFGDEIQTRRGRLSRRAIVHGAARAARFRHGRCFPTISDFIKRNIKLRRGMKVAVDGGNGCGGVVAAPLMRELGLETIELYIEMDGRFPNHHPDPTVEENMRDLQAAVKAQRRGNRDRLRRRRRPVGAVDENGRIVWGDELMVAFSRAILKERPGAAIIGDVKCSQAHVRRYRAQRRPPDHVEDRPFADQEQAQGGARGARRRDERAYVFRRPLFRLRRRDLRLVPAARNRQPRGPRPGRDSGRLAARARSRRRFASIAPTTQVRNRAQGRRIFSRASTT